MRVIRSLHRVAVVAGALALAVSPLRAQSWIASLSGPNESPVNSSPGIGVATFSLSGNLLTINASFSGLTGTTTASHIHCCTTVPFVGVAGVATQTPSFALFPLGVTAGTFMNTLDLTLASSFNPAFVTANGASVSNARAALINGMNSGTTYFNIHTSTFGGGEIRGFITAVPEPGSVVLVASGLLAVGAATYRRKRAA